MLASRRSNGFFAVILAAATSAIALAQTTAGQKGTTKPPARVESAQDLADKMASAAENGDIATVRTLLEKRANVNAIVMPASSTALQLAVQNGRRQIVELLIGKGADVNLTGNGTTPLIGAATFGYKAILTVLLDKGANVDAVDTQGKTALYYASSAGNDDVVEMLVAHGANASQKTARSQYWIRGEVTSIDAAKNQLVLKLLAGSVVGINKDATEIPFDASGALYFGVTSLKGLKLRDVVNVAYSGSLAIGNFNYAAARGSGTLSYKIKYLALLSE